MSNAVVKFSLVVWGRLIAIWLTLDKSILRRGLENKVNHCYAWS